MTIAQEHPVDAVDNSRPRTLAELNTLIAAAKPLVAGATRAVLGEGPIGAHQARKGDNTDLFAQP